MCGRFTLRTPLTLLAEQFQFDFAQASELFDAPPGPRFNIAPTQEIAAVRRAADGGRELALLHWGLIPSWAKDRKLAASLINARCETVAEKPAFRTAFTRRRCLVLADGFFEWKKIGKAKQPYYFRLRDERPFAFAGMWETWRGGPGGSGPAVQSCTLITTQPNELTATVHDRMPVILHPSDYELWLDPAVTDRKRLEPLLRPYDAEAMQADEVSTYVNNPRHDDPQVLA